MRAMKIDDIGGGRVVRGFTSGSERVRVGTELTQAFLAAMPTSNLNVLIDKNFIHVWPKAAAVSPPSAVSGRAAERHIVSLGFGRYNVVEGTVLNAKHLTKDEAEKLAGHAGAKKKD